MNRQRLSVLWVSAVCIHRVIIRRRGDAPWCPPKPRRRRCVFLGASPDCEPLPAQCNELEKVRLVSVAFVDFVSLWRLPRSHVSSFHPPGPLRSGHVRTGWFDHSASQGTWQNTITDVRPQGSGAFSTFHVPRSHVSSFHPPGPLRSGHVCTGWFDHSASQGTWRNTITDVRPQGSGAFSTFHVPRSTFHVQRSTFNSPAIHFLETLRRHIPGEFSQYPATRGFTQACCSIPIGQ